MHIPKVRHLKRPVEGAVVRRLKFHARQKIGKSVDDSKQEEESQRADQKSNVVGPREVLNFRHQINVDNHHAAESKH